MLNFDAKIVMSNFYAKIVMLIFDAKILMPKLPCQVFRPKFWWHNFDSDNCSIFNFEFGFPGMHFVEMLRLERIIGLYKSCLTGMT